MYEIYSVESRKGGVGKTTIALNLAKVLVKKKYDVLLIDCDITGTPISKAALHSPYWTSDVVVSMKGGKPYNLIEFFNNVFLKGLDREQEIIEGMDLSPKKVHLIGSEIYDENSQLIIDPRDLMDDLHSYWYMDFIKKIAKKFCDSTKQEKKAIVLDNSPGYVGVGRSVREWLTKVGPEQVTFVLVSSLDEQDIDSTIDSAEEIQRMMQTGKKVSSYVKVLVNKVPEGLLTENSGYDFKVEKGTDRDALISELFPLGRDKYPKNLIKYDNAISGQFIEASLKPKTTVESQNLILVDSLRKLKSKAATFESKQDPYADIAAMDTIYKKVLKALEGCGLVRMSMALGGDLTPNYMLKGLKITVGRIGSIVYPGLTILGATKDNYKELILEELKLFLSKMDLAQYTAIFSSLTNGLFKAAGIDRKDSSIYKVINLSVLLLGFFRWQNEFYHKTDYREFLKKEIEQKGSRKRHITRSLEKAVRDYSKSEPDKFEFMSNLLNSSFSGFYNAMCYSLLRMIDCARDYTLIVNVCKFSLDNGNKTMSKDLTGCLKAVISKKTKEPDYRMFRQLVEEPSDMKTIQSLIKSYVLSK